MHINYSQYKIKEELQAATTKHHQVNHLALNTRSTPPPLFLVVCCGIKTFSYFNPLLNNNSL